ncbi:hypothetical protein Tco_0871286 [Tanacetum coccineum]
MAYPCHWFSEQVGLAGDLGSTNDVLIPLVEMDDSKLTMEEYIELEAEKAHRHGQTFNWETTTYGKNKYHEDINYLKDFETDFPVIIFDDPLGSDHKISSEPTISPLDNNDFDFKISFDESDIEDYTVIYDKNLFSYKLISVNDLKTDSKNDTDELGGDRHSMTWRQFILALGLHTVEEMAGDGFKAYWVGSLREIATKGDLSSYWSRIASDGDFSETVPSYTSSRDPLRRLCHRLIAVSISVRGQAPEKVTATDLFYLRRMDEGTTMNVPYLLAQYLFRHTKGRKCGARMSGGHFVGRLAKHFGLVTEEGLQGLTMVVGELKVIIIDELVRLRICERVGDTKAWVAPGLERQQMVAARFA